MKKWPIVLCLGMLLMDPGFSAELEQKVWNRGSEDCTRNQDPAIEVFRFDAATYVLRQNKCVHFEAPFIYVLFGAHTVLVHDTGATADPERFPLYAVVQSLLAQQDATQGSGFTEQRRRVLVTHSHSHSDHTAADGQFRGRMGVTLVEPNAKAVREYFGFANWPDGTATIDLGGRELIVMPIPGHQDESIAVHDSRTGWLLTGDTLYPGRVNVNDWSAYASSIRRLVELSKTHRISAVMGGHIEMSRSGTLFPAGSTFQPNEAGLALTLEDLLTLDQRLHQAGADAREIATSSYHVAQAPWFARALSKSLRWVGVR
jgi:glyoxylase-like metal-dependent hydrolase (beta-lactamase superfamily II)